MPNLQELIQKVQAEGGTYIYTSHDGSVKQGLRDGKGYKIVDYSGFKKLDGEFIKNKEGNIVVKDYPDGNLEAEVSGEGELNEVILYKKRTKRKVIGHKRVGGFLGFGGKKEEIYEDVPIKSKDMFENDDETLLHEITYIAKREQPDAVGRENMLIQIGLVASEELIKSIMEELKKQSHKASELLPKLFENLGYTSKPNGKILFREEDKKGTIVEYQR